MNEYQKLLHEIESKKQELEQRIAFAVQKELAQWQSENDLAVKSIYINLADVSYVGSSKRYEVVGADIDIDYKP